MIYYKKLDDNFVDYGIQKLNFSELNFPNEQPHEWVYLPVNEVFTSAGLQFFKDKNIKLRSTARIFKIIAGCQISPIHIDSEYYDAAFNFVVEGDGKMEWVTVDGIESYSSYTQSNASAGAYKRIVDFSKIEINDSWSGKCALVRIGTPHRVLGGTHDRYCVSARPAEDHFFNDLVKIV